MKDLIAKCKISESGEVLANQGNENGKTTGTDTGKGPAGQDGKAEIPTGTDTGKVPAGEDENTKNSNEKIKIVCWHKLDKEDQNMTKCTTEPDICDFAWTLCVKSWNLKRTVEENEKYVPEWLMNDSQTLQQIYLTAYLNIFLKMFVTFNYIMVLNDTDGEIT